MVAADPASGGSKRPEETVTPLAAALGTSIDLKYPEGEEAAMVASLSGLSGLSGPTLVCWEHTGIPTIISHLGRVTPPPPTSWPGSVFNIVFVFTRSGNGWNFTQVPQELLAGACPGQPGACQAGLALRVGALFFHDAAGGHYCAASVVASPGRDLLITAAHRINSGKGGSYRQGIVFIPDYRDGQAPFGIWTPARMLVAPQWISSSDPNLDVGFVVLNPHDGENTQQVLSADRLGIDSGYRYLVRVTGSPGQRWRPGHLRQPDLPAERHPAAV